MGHVGKVNMMYICLYIYIYVCVCGLNIYIYIYIFSTHLAYKNQFGGQQPQPPTQDKKATAPFHAILSQMLLAFNLKRCVVTRQEGS